LNGIWGGKHNRGNKSPMSFVQREHYRVPCNVPVIIELGGAAVLEATCNDISMGGMGILLQKEIAPRSQGLVKMHYEQEDRKILFTAKFSVAWAHPEKPDPSQKRAGIQFLEVDEDNKSILANILVKRLQELEGTSTDSN
jgi:c-di-GMP-binding flagellar brake protein YcgR